MVEAIRGEQRGHRGPRRRAGAVSPGNHHAPREDLPDEDADGAIARLTRRVDGQPPGQEPLREQRTLCGRPGAIDPLNDDEMAFDHEPPSFGLPNLNVAPNWP